MEINSGKSIYHFNEFHLEDRQCTYKSDIEARSLNHAFRGKAISVTYSEYVFVALIIHDAMRTRRIILSSVACPILPYFSTLPHKNCRIFGDKNIIEHKRVF